MVFTLYAYQGLVAGFALTALPNHLAGTGASAAAIGQHLATVGLPWTLQPLWGPLVDRFGGSRMGARRAWMLAALAGSLATLAVLPLLGDQATLTSLSLVLMGHAAAAALLDTATDALVIDRVPTHALGAASACTRAGFVTGTAAGAWIFAWALPTLGLRQASLLLLGIGAVAMLAPLLVREAPGDALLSAGSRPRTAGRAGTSPRRLLRLLRAALSRRETLALLALCVAEEAAGSAFGVRLSFMLIQEGGWDAGALSRLQGSLILGAGTLGALLVGRWADRVGALPALSWLLACCAVAHLGSAWLVGAARLPAFGPIALGLSVIVPALVFVALAPAVMRASRGGAAATQFALFMAALNLGGVAGAGASAGIAAVLPLPAMALLAALVFALCAAAARRPRLLFRPGALVDPRAPMPPHGHQPPGSSSAT